MNFKLVYKREMFVYIITKRIITSEPISNLRHILTVKIPMRPISSSAESKYQAVKCRSSKTRLVSWLANI